MDCDESDSKTFINAKKLTLLNNDIIYGLIYSVWNIISYNLFGLNRFFFVSIQFE